MAPHAEVGTGFSNGNGVAATPANKDLFVVNSPNVNYSDNEINTKYTYRTTLVSQGEDGKYIATPKETLYDFKVDRKVPKTGVMLVGWGGNNGKFRHSYLVTTPLLGVLTMAFRYHCYRWYPCQPPWLEVADS
jgi:hypothetical protein